jgi:regulator of sigma E protease
LSSAHKEVGRIGVVLTGAREPVGVGRAIVHGVEHSVGAVVMVSYGLAEMIRGRVAPQASGPVGIAAMTAERLRIGWTAVVQLLGIISANLAVINLFPIPPFDGFRIALLGIEGVMGRRVDAKKELAVTIAGVALLLGLFLVITFRDILNLVFYSTP